MARIFDVTAASDSVRLDARGQGEMPFTATNVSGRHLRGRAVLIAEDAASKSWLSLSGDAERDFPIGGVQQFGVKVAVPAGTKPGSYKFRLDVVSVENPDEDYAQGPTVAASVTLPPVPPRPFPWWIPVVAVVVLLVVGGVVAYVLFTNKVEVPRIVGMDPTAAKNALEAKHLKAEPTGEERTGNVTPGLVSRQDPVATSATSVKVPKDSTVKYWVEPAPLPSTPPTVTRPVPDVTTAHLDQDTAIRTLLNAGFMIDPPSYKVADMRLLGKVIDQNPKGEADPSKPVHLTIGKLLQRSPQPITAETRNLLKARDPHFRFPQ